MEWHDYWRLCDELTVIQAALLIADEDPSSTQTYVEQWEPEKRPLGYEAAKAAISKALRSGAIEGNWAGDEIEGSIYVAESEVEVESLRKWLSSRGCRPAFFFPPKEDEPDYLDPDNPRYAPKLAAAVQAWQAVTDPAGHHPRQALIKWLREHAADFGLTDEEGKLNETGIDQVATVANWRPSGGAPKTPGS